MRSALIFALFLTTPALAGDAPADSAENVIKYRQKLMSAVGAHMGMTSMIRKGEWSRVGDAVGHATAMHEAGKQFAASFPKGTGPETKIETEALPEIWKDWAGFEAAIQKYETATAKLVEVAKGGNVAAIDAQFKEVGASCGGCHKKFRVDDDK